MLGIIIICLLLLRIIIRIVFPYWVLWVLCNPRIIRSDWLMILLKLIFFCLFTERIFKFLRLPYRDKAHPSCTHGYYNSSKAA